MHWFCIQFLLWQDVKPYSNSKHVLAGFAWSKFLLQVLAFRDDSKRKGSSKINVSYLLFEAAELSQVKFSSSWILECDGRCTSEALNVANNLLFKFEHVLQPRTEWPIQCGHFIGSTSHFNKGGIFKFNLYAHRNTSEQLLSFFFLKPVQTDYYY